MLRKQAHTFSSPLFWFFSRLARHPLKRNTAKTAEPLCVLMYFTFSTERQAFQLTLWADNIIELHLWYKQISIYFENWNILTKEGSKHFFPPAKTSTRYSARRDERHVTNPDLSLLEIQPHGSCIYLDFWVVGLQELEMEKVNVIIKSILAQIDWISGKQCIVMISKTERSMVSSRLLLTELLTLAQGMFS